MSLPSGWSQTTYTLSISPFIQGAHQHTGDDFYALFVFSVKKNHKLFSVPRFRIEKFPSRDNCHTVSLRKKMNLYVYRCALSTCLSLTTNSEKNRQKLGKTGRKCTPVKYKISFFSLQYPCSFCNTRSKIHTIVNDFSIVPHTKLIHMTNEIYYYYIFDTKNCNWHAIIQI